LISNLPRHHTTKNSKEAGIAGLLFISGPPNTFNRTTARRAAARQLSGIPVKTGPIEFIKHLKRVNSIPGLINRKTILYTYFNMTPSNNTAKKNPVINMNNSKTKILVADDDPVYREVAREALESAGHFVTVASDGAEAIQALKTIEFDAAVIDLTMPKADGIAVIQSVRANSLNSTTPIIVVTGHDDSDAIERAYTAGATSFLTKPLNWVLFTPHVNFVLRSGQVENELRDATAAAAFLSDLKTQMMGALAREFQTPIKTIFGFAELIRKEVYGPMSPPMYREMATDMGNAAQKLNAAFLTLLNFGNALTEQLQFAAEPTLIASVLDDAMATAEDHAGRKGINLSRKVDIPVDTLIQADRVLLVQAIRSVLSNAIKVAPRGSTVEVHAGIGNNGNFKIWAVDQGPPIPAGLIAEIAGPAITRSARTHDYETRDVGIKIAKILTEAHQGQLLIKSDAASGNTVTLDLPLARPAPVTAPSTAPKAESPAERLAAISEALAADPRVRAGRTEQQSASSSTRSPNPDVQLGARTALPNQARPLPSFKS
jgi:CheY-like chemotaxis protein